MLAFVKLNSNTFKHLVYEIWEKEKGMEMEKATWAPSPSPPLLAHSRPASPFPLCKVQMARGG
jgi:hypothetical protein